MPIHASLGPLGNFHLSQSGEEPHGGPALLVGTGGDVRPEPADGGQAQIMQQQRQTCGIDLDLAHAAAASMRCPPSSASYIAKAGSTTATGGTSEGFREK